jgi:hypothetical protein
MTFAEEFPFLWNDAEPDGLRIARCCELALTPGTMGFALRHDFYKEFIACGYDQDLSAVRTSCAIFARAVLHWSGRRATRKGKPGQGIFGGWLEGLSMSAPSWCFTENSPLVPGAIIYRDYNRATTNLGHVQILVREMEPGKWLTAEGGGSLTPEEASKLSVADAKATNGTVCRLSAKPKDVLAKDSMGRIAIGFWTPERLGLERANS